MPQPNNGKQPRDDYQHVWFLVAILLVLGLALAWQLMLTVRAHAEVFPDCRSIKAVMVLPQAVVHQPDGDTFHIYTFDVPNVVKIRVKDADTPEHGQAGYEEAKELTRTWLSRGPFRVITCGTPTLDRIVGIVSREGETLADVLKAAGYWREKH